MSAGTTTTMTPENTRPTVLLIPGAWFPPPAYNNFLQAIRNLGYQTECATYPSLNPKDPMHADAATDTSFVVKNYLIPLIEIEQKDVVIVMHSYGGIPGSGAATGFGKAARQRQGRRGGVVGLVHSSGFVLPEGLSCADGQGGSLPPWIKQNYPLPGLTLVEDPVNVFSADVTPAVAQAFVSQILPHALLAFKSPAPKPAWSEAGFDGRLAYLVCTEDRAIPPFAQHAMMQGIGKRWLVQELEGSHSAPFLNKIREAVQALDGFIRSFVAVQDTEDTLLDREVSQSEEQTAGS